MASSSTRSTDPLTDLSPEEILDTALQKMQSGGIEPVEWFPLLHQRMNVPRVATVSRPGLLHFQFDPSARHGITVLFISRS